MRFLLFTLYGPLAAHGEVAVGERRMGWDRPARSAILGMIGAALGVDRTNEDGHRALDEGLWYAVRTDSDTRPFTDYHTTQVPGTRRNRTFSARREELQAEDCSTILSTREWRSDALYTVALWPKPSNTADLDAIAGALSRPHFVLYVGRKAGPLGWPLNPRIVEAATLVDALQADPARSDETQNRWLKRRSQSSLAFDAEAETYGAPRADRIVVRRDRLVSRARWQFAERREGIVERLLEAAR